MNSADNEGAFPPTLPWEEFTEQRVTIEQLRDRAAKAQTALVIAHLFDTRSPTFDRSAVAALLATAEDRLEVGRRETLLTDLSAIGAWYLMPAARTVADADLDATRRHLAYLSRRGEPALIALRHILCLMPSVIDDAIAADEDAASHGSKLDALGRQGLPEGRRATPAGTDKADQRETIGPASERRPRAVRTSGIGRRRGG